MDAVLEVFTEAVIKALIVIIPVLFAVLTAFIVRFLQAQMAKLEREGRDFELYLLQEFTQMAVLAAEQLLEAGEEKYDYAAESLVDWATSAGIELTEEQAMTLIEGTVFAIQNELPPSGYLIEATIEEQEDVKG